MLYGYEEEEIFISQAETNYFNRLYLKKKSNNY